MREYQQRIQVHSWQNNPQHTSYAQMGTWVNCVMCPYGREHVIILITVYWALLGNKNRYMWLLGTGTNIPLAFFAMWSIYFILFFEKSLPWLEKKGGCQNGGIFGRAVAFDLCSCHSYPVHSAVPYGHVWLQKKQNRQPHSVSSMALRFPCSSHLLMRWCTPQPSLGGPRRSFPWRRNWRAV